MNRKFWLLLVTAMMAMLLVACGGSEAEDSAADADAGSETVAETSETMDEEDHSDDADEAMESDDAMDEEDHSGDADEAMEAEDHSDDAMDSDSDAMAADDAMEESDDMAAGNVVYAINAGESSLSWRGAKAIGDFHTGTIDISEGSVEVVDGELVAGSFVIDMTSIANDDLSGGMNTRLVNHLKSDDFFSTESFPTAEIVIGSAESNGDGTYNVVADVTIKGITNPVEFVATASEDGSSFTASADIVFDRSLFDVQFGSGSFFDNLGDDLINDEIELTVELVANS